MIEPITNTSRSGSPTPAEQSPRDAVELTLSSIKDYLSSKGGRTKYSELYDRFRDVIIDSTTEDKFQEFVSNIAIKKYENDSKDEWIVLKKKYMDSNVTSPPHTGFFASKLQKTKNNLTKFSNKALFMQKDKQQQQQQQDPTNKSFLNNSIRIVGKKSSAASVSSSSFMPSASHSATNLANMMDATTNDQDTLNTSRSIENINQANVHGNHPTSSVSTPSRRSNSLIDLDKTAVFKLSSSSNNLNEQTISNNNENDDDSCDQISHISENNIHKNNTNNGSDKYLDQTLKIDQSNNVKSVKEHAKKLNRLNTELELKNLNDMSLKSLSNANKSNNSSLNDSSSSVKFKANKMVEIECFDFSDPKPHEKEWIIICSRGDYMEIAKILSKQPYLAQKKDPFNGYTCAHWACRYGNVEILKLLASTLENDTKTNPKSLRINHLINSKTRGGYTCLHIAYVYNHSELVPYLKTYGAEALTDYNGKNGIDYSRNCSFNDYHPSQVIDLNDTKTSDINNDANTFIKRSSSVILAKEKENKEGKEDKEAGFLSMKVTSDSRNQRGKIIGMVESPFRRNNPTVFSHSSPLNQIETSNDSNRLMPPPKTAVQLKPNTKQTDESNVNEPESVNLRESKENLFI